MAGVDVAALRKVAEAATPGPWVAETWGHGGETRYVVATTPLLGAGFDVAEVFDGGDGEGHRMAQRVHSRANAEHIAAFDPPTVLVLLDRLEAAEAKVARVEALKAAAQLEPAENMALTVAWHQVERGEEPMPNVAAVCVIALERIRRAALEDRR